MAEEHLIELLEFVEMLATINEMKWRCSGGPIVRLLLRGRDSGILAGLQAALNARLGIKGPISETNNKIQLTMKRKKFFWCAPQIYPNGTRGDNFPKDLGLPLFLSMGPRKKKHNPRFFYTNLLLETELPKLPLFSFLILFIEK